MKGYAILSEKEHLKLLCYRGGFFIEKIININNNLDEKMINDHIKKELNIPNFRLKIDENKKYKFYELELKILPLYLSKFFHILRHFINGTLIIYELD
jgi:hypothetical protein